MGRRTTDRYIVQHSGILDIIEPYDLVLADRGFTIREDLLFRHADLEIPPPPELRAGKNESESESAYVHVSIVTPITIVIIRGIYAPVTQ